MKLSQFLNEGIGKRIGRSVYVHRQYARQVLPLKLLDEGIRAIGAFNYTIVKWDMDGQGISFIYSPDWDSADEPQIGVVKVFKNGRVKTIDPPKDPWIYHHKWMFVGPDYMGFDVQQSKERSKQWASLPIDKSRIGKKSYWENNVLPLLENKVNN